MLVCLVRFLGTPGKVGGWVCLACSLRHFYYFFFIDLLIFYFCIRAHYAFLMDCLDAFTAGACLHLLDMENLDSEPNRKQEIFETQSAEDKIKFIRQIAKDILDRYVNLSDGKILLRR